MMEGWFHCGRCGAIFRGKRGDRCGECGGDPVIHSAEIAFLEAEKAGPSTMPTPSRDAGRDGARVKPRRPGEKRRIGLLTFSLIWVAVLGVIVGGATVYRNFTRMMSEEKPIEAQIEWAPFLDDAHQKCPRLLVAFLRDGIPELRVRHVLGGTATLGKIVNSEAKFPLYSAEESPEMIYFKPFMSPLGPAIESAWKDPDGRRFEIVFYRNEEKEWKIDWEQAVRYSAQSWPLFLSGAGAQEADFRLYVRQRAEFGGGEGSVSNLLFLEPRMFDPQAMGLRSPAVSVDPRSEMGRRLEHAFDMRGRDIGVLGTSLFKDDQQGAVRVHVRLRRSDEPDSDGDYDFTLEELHSCHWMSFEGEELTEEEFEAGTIEVLKEGGGAVPER